MPGWHPLAPFWPYVNGREAWVLPPRSMLAPSTMRHFFVFCNKRGASKKPFHMLKRRNSVLKRPNAFKWVAKRRGETEKESYFAFQSWSLSLSHTHSHPLFLSIVPLWFETLCSFHCCLGELWPKEARNERLSLKCLQCSYMLHVRTHNTIVQRYKGPGIH